MILSSHEIDHDSFVSKVQSDPMVGWVCIQLVAGKACIWPGGCV